MLLVYKLNVEEAPASINNNNKKNWFIFIRKLKEWYNLQVGIKYFFLELFYTYNIFI